MISGKAQLEGNFLDEKCRRCISRGSFFVQYDPASVFTNYKRVDGVELYDLFRRFGLLLVFTNSK